MELIDICFGTVIVISVVYLILLGVKQRKEDKRIKSMPIDIFRYTYKVYLNDGSDYIRTSVGWFTFGFEEFVKRCILTDRTLRINNELVVNTENISKFELIEIDLESIKPILEDCVGEKFIREIYFPEEVIKQKLLNKRQ